MSGYAIDSIGFNPYQYANDQAFWNAYNSYNVNYKGANQTATAATTTSQPADTTTTSPSFKSLPKADYSESSSSKGLVTALVATGLGVATLVYAQKRGNGEGIKAGFKNIWNGLKGSFTKSADEVADAAGDVAKDKLNKLKIIYEKGKPKFYVPGKTETITDPTEIANFLKKNAGLKGVRTKTGETTILDGTFEFVHNKTNNTITFKNGKVTGLQNDKGENILAKFFDKDGKISDSIENTTDGGFAQEVLEQIAKIKDGKLSAPELKELKLRDFRYKTQIGDNTYEAVRKTITDNHPQHLKLTRLETLDAGSEKFKSYLYEMQEQGVDISAVTQNIEKGKLPQGFKVSEFTLDFGSGKKILVLDGKPVAMMEGGKTYDLSTDKFKAFLVDTTGSKNNEKLILDDIKRILEKNKIPEGATIVQV